MRDSGTNRNNTDDVHLDTELLSAYVDGEVTPAEATLVERHVQTCRVCTDELEALRWTVSLMREVPPVPVPRSFGIRQADIEPAPTRRPLALPEWFFGALQWATVATAVLTLLVFSFDFLMADRLADVPQSMQALEAPQVAPQPVEEEVEAPEAEAARELAPSVATLNVERTEEVELAGAPEEEPAQHEKRPSTQEDLAEAQAGRSAAEPTVAPALEQPEERRAAARAPLRTIEIGLTVLLAVLLVLTLWARRRKPA